MRFEKHSELEDRHAFFSPSSYAWIRYDDDKIEKMYMKHLAKVRGTREHAWAQETIELGFRMPEENRTMNMYVNDCIGWRMTPEVPLKYSEDCFGRADALGFRNNTLRVSDYKSGQIPSKMDQLKIYAALFCLEYDMDPFQIKIELRIYQTNNIVYLEPEGEEIFFMMRQIVGATKIVERIRREALS